MFLYSVSNVDSHLNNVEGSDTAREGKKIKNVVLPEQGIVGQNNALFLYKVYQTFLLVPNVQGALSKYYVNFKQYRVLHIEYAD